MSTTKPRRTSSASSRAAASGAARSRGTHSTRPGPPSSSARRRRRASRRATSTRSSPRLRRARENASPMPLEAPVTNATSRNVAYQPSHGAAGHDGTPATARVSRALAVPVVAPAPAHDRIISKSFIINNLYETTSSSARPGLHSVGLAMQRFQGRLQRSQDLLACGMLLLELDREDEALPFGLEAEDIVPRSSPRAPGRFVPREPPYVRARRPLAAESLDQRCHFFRATLSNDLKENGLRLDVGQPTHLANALRHGRERQRLRDGRAALAELLRHHLVRVVVGVDERLQPIRLFERRQVLALQVLDQRELHRLGVVGLPDDAGDLTQAGLNGGAVPSLAGDDLMAVPDLPDEKGLENALLPDGSRQL